MSDLTVVPARLGPSDVPVSVGSLLAGWFAEADRRVAAAEVQAAPPTLFDLACDVAVGQVRS